MRLARTVLLSTSLLSATLAGAATPMAQQPGRLPADVVPIHYDITVDPDAAKMTFTGQETITVTVARPTTTRDLPNLILRQTPASQTSPHGFRWPSMQSFSSAYR